MGGVRKLRPPQPLSEDHLTTDFVSGEATLDLWLKKRALANQSSGASRTYVICHEKNVVGYYALATGAVDLNATPKTFRRNMPDPIPAILIARLAISQPAQGQGLGRALLRDALIKIKTASEHIGIALILVHAISQQAKQFYLSCGFRQSPIDDLVLMARVKDIESALT